MQLSNLKNDNVCKTEESKLRFTCMVSNKDQFVWYFKVLYYLFNATKIHVRYLEFSGWAPTPFDLSYVVHNGCSPEPDQMYVPTVIYVTGSVLG